MPLKILSYNIHHGEGTDGKLDLQRVAAIINASGADLVALQEVDRRVLRSGNVDQPQELAKLTNMRVAFGPNIQLQGGDYGNAILSRFRIASSENHPLPNVDRGEQRGVLFTTLELADGTQIRFGSTHFDHRPKPEERIASAWRINQLLDGDDSMPTLLAGDFNSGLGSSVLKILNNRWASSSAIELPTIPVTKPTRQIDFVLLGRQWSFRPVETKVLPQPVASDHLPILATVELPTDASEGASPISCIAFGSCIKQEQPVPILRTIQNEHPDVVVFLGDNIYADTSEPAEMLRKYEALRSKAEFQDLRAECDVMATWDDHDFGINDGGDDFQFKTTSQELFLNFWHEPLGTTRRETPGVYYSREFGPVNQRVQVIMLDTRYFRSPLKKGGQAVGGPYVPDADESKTMLGDPQWGWLEEQLQRPAQVRIIATSIQCLASSSGQETWSNLPLQRAKFFKLLKDTQAEGVILISGDRHWSELSVLPDVLSRPLFELTSSSLNQIHARGTPTDNAFRAVPATVHQPNYGLIKIDWSAERPAVRLEIRDLEGASQLSHAIGL